MSDLNELYLCIEELRIRIEKLEQDSHPPVEWEGMIGTNAESIEELKKEMLIIMSILEVLQKRLDKLEGVDGEGRNTETEKQSVLTK